MKCYEVVYNEWKMYYTVNPSGIFDFFKDDTLLGYTSSYNILAARLLGLSYPDYLKYCASIGAKLRGSEGYAYPSWKEKTAADKLCKRLNEEWDKVVKECFGKES